MISEEYKQKEKEVKETCKKMLIISFFLVVAGMALDFFTNVQVYIVYETYIIAVFAVFIAADEQIDLSLALLKEFDNKIERLEKEIREGKDS